jgi:tripeptide aminopeptidase
MGAIPAIGARAVAAMAASKGVKETVQLLHRDKQWVNEKHLEVCRIPAPTFQEHRRAEWLLGAFRAMGCEAKIDAAGNVVGFLQPNAPPPYVALTAHMDTVLAPQRPEDVCTEPDGTFFGPGVSDNGAGLAGLLAIARAMKSAAAWAGMAASPVFIANVGEEGEGDLCGMRYLCTQSPLAAKVESWIVLDGPSTEHLTCQALASRRYEIVLQGPGGHSWVDFGTVNPVHAMARTITVFAENVGQAGTGAGMSFNFGLIEGGVSVNAIPASARAKVDMRAVEEAALEKMRVILEASVTRACAWEGEKSTAGKLVSKLREVGARPGGSLAQDAPLLQQALAVDAYLGISSSVDCASTDANIPLSLGMPALAIGAGGTGGGAHTAGEWFKPAGRSQGLERAVLLLAMAMAG